MLTSLLLGLAVGVGYNAILNHLAGNPHLRLGDLLSVALFMGAAVLGTDTLLTTVVVLAAFNAATIVANYLIEKFNDGDDSTLIP